MLTFVIVALLALSLCVAADIKHWNDRLEQRYKKEEEDRQKNKEKDPTS